MARGALEGKVAVVTGGASGIGAASVRRFVAEGARVVVGDVQAEAGEALAADLGEAARFVRADVAREDDVRALIGTALDAFGALDCLFNNAGLGGARGAIDEIPADAWDETFGVLLRGVFLGMKHAVPVMRRQGAGSILSTASVAGLQAGLGPHAYSAAKAGVVQLTRTVATEVGPHGVRVNCICPGGVLTPLLTQAVGPGPEARTLVEGFLRQLQPLRRAGLPEDIAEAAVWLASDASSFVTGQALVVDGGLTAGRPWGGPGAARGDGTAPGG